MKVVNDFIVIYKYDRLMLLIKCVIVYYDFIIKIVLCYIYLIWWKKIVLKMFLCFNFMCFDNWW